MSSEADQAPAFRVLAPAGWTGDLDEFLRTARRRVQPPFSPERISTLARLSQEILAHPRLRRDPAGAALGFWLRPAHLADLRTDFERGRPATGMRVPAGLVIHITPANVDTMFVFSWALSFLVGNANVVRLTTRGGPMMEDLLECLNRVLADLPAIGQANVFAAYGHDAAITAKLSAACDTRIIWGGDETVRRIRAIPLNPHASERAFASKRSLSVFGAARYLATDDEGRSSLAAKMAGDLAPFNQLACSSPHTLYWLGTRDEGVAAGADLGERLESAMAGKLGEPDAGWAARRIQFAFGAAAEGCASSIVHHPHTTAVHATGPSGSDTSELCGGGFLTHVAGVSLEEVGQGLRVDNQTISHFGLDATERDRLAEIAGLAGVDRLVPVGRALDFGPQWDGYDLWSDFSRVVVVV